MTLSRSATGRVRRPHQPSMRAAELTPCQEADLLRRRYRYAMDEFRFDMTLAGTLAATPLFSQRLQSVNDFPRASHQ